MRVTLRYTGQLAAAAGKGEEVVECAAGVPLVEAVRGLAGDGRDGLFGELVLRRGGGFQPTVLLVVDGEQVGGDRDGYCPEDGASVTLMTPIAGG